MLFSQKSLITYTLDDFTEYPKQLKSNKTTIILFGQDESIDMDLLKLLNKVSPMVVGIRYGYFKLPFKDKSINTKLVVYKDCKAVKYIPTDNITVNILIKYSLKLN